MADDIVARARAERDHSPRGLPWGMADELVAEVERLRSYKSLPDGMVWQDYASPDDVCKIREEYDRERREFTARLGYGDGITEPAATLAQIVEPIEAAFSEARDHQECPRLCESCGETLASTQCPDCHGSGCGPGTALGAYDECENCGGGGWIHDGCAEASYVDLVAELAELRDQVPPVGELSRAFAAAGGEIERHRAEVERLRGALDRLANEMEGADADCTDSGMEAYHWAGRRLRYVLAGGQ